MQETKIYTIAKTISFSGHGGGHDEQMICKTGAYGGGQFPPFFFIKNEAEEYNLKLESWNRGDVVECVVRCNVEIVKSAERYELLRTLTPHEFKQLWQDNISGKGYFDELVDKMIEVRK